MNAKPSPLNARALRLMRDTDCRIHMGNNSYSNPQIDTHGTEAHGIGLQIRLQRRNVIKMLGEDWIKIVKHPEDTWKQTEYGITAHGIDVLNYLNRQDFKPSTIQPYFSADEIKAILQDWHQSQGGWIFLVELGIDGRRIDAYALGMWASYQFIAISYEIKTSRADLLADFKDPAKRRPALENSHQFYYVTTKGLAHHTEFPPGVGLIEIWENKSRHIVIDAPLRKISCPSWKLAGIIARNAAQQYHRRYNWDRDEWLANAD
jgi:hypothetical protein